MKTLIFSLLLSLLAVPPGQNFYRLETEHFVVNFPAGQEDLAAEISGIAEDVHRRLSPLLQYTPLEKTQIVLTTHTDISNGLATTFPLNTIEIYSAPPPVESFLAYRDWIYTLVLHEYTHILHLDQARGLTAVFRKIFGRVIFPNAVEPTWLIEGIATHAETELGGKGRGRNPFSDLVLQTAAREKRFPPIDRGSGTLASWPGGKYPYIFGSGFYRYLSETYGAEMPYRLEISHSRMFLPFLITLNSRKILGKSYPALWREWEQSLREKSLSPAVSPSGNPEPRLLTATHEFTYGARYSPSGREIVYTQENPREYPGLFLIPGDRPDSPRKLVLRNSGSTLTFGPEGKSLIFNQEEINWKTEIVSDLYRFDLEEKRLVRLTRGRHLTYPDYSPARDALAATRLLPGRSEIILLDRAGDNPETVWSGTAELPLAFEPRFSPDGQILVFSAADSSGNLDLYLLDLSSRNLERLTSDPGDDISPTWSPDGKEIIFSSSRNGKYNLYAYSPSGKNLRQVTNLEAGAFAPAVSPDGKEIIFSGYQASGFDLFTIPYEPEKWHSLPPENPEPVSATVNGNNQSLANLSTHQRTNSPAPYSPWAGLIPRFWLPFYSYSSLDGTAVGLTTGGRDVLGRHLYILNPFYHTGAKRVGGYLYYEENSFYPRFSLSASLDYSRMILGQEESRSISWQPSQESRVAVSFPFLSYQKSAALELAFNQNYEKPICAQTSWGKPCSLWLLGPEAAFIYDSARAFPLSPGTIQGQWAILGVEKTFSILEGEVKNITRFRVDEMLFFPLPARAAASLRTGFSYRPDSSYQLTPRGYPDLFPKYAALVGLNLKTMPWVIERGLSTLPVYLNLVYLSVFSDLGLSGSDLYELHSFRVGVGGSLNLKTTFGYALPVFLGLSCARGLNENGETQIYATIDYEFWSLGHEHRRNPEIFSRRR
ncbi:MAG: hypothetical protein NT056_00270 [Proteobacteria bacterium]|nr:hypothetical protein [Pseudomonadota bacterium]